MSPRHTTFDLVLLDALMSDCIVWACCRVLRWEVLLAWPTACLRSAARTLKSSSRRSWPGTGTRMHSLVCHQAARFSGCSPAITTSPIHLLSSIPEIPRERSHPCFSSPVFQELHFFLFANLTSWWKRCMGVLSLYCAVLCCAALKFSMELVSQESPESLS